MADADLLARLHRNLMTVSALNGAIPGGRLDQRDGELLYSASADAPFLNGVLREPPYGDAPALLERARVFFADRGEGFTVYVHPDDPELAATGIAMGLLELVQRYPEMVCRAPLPEPAGDLRTVESVADAAAYWAICDEAYPSIGIRRGSFTEACPPELLLGDDVEACLGYADGVPVACASTWRAEGIGMVGWVGTLPQARTRGLGTAVTVWATNRAFALGADVAALQASVMGEPIYARLGYEVVYAYRMLGGVVTG
jgi:GNAT superfamily N-acetyltransferase